MQCLIAPGSGLLFKSLLGLKFERTRFLSYVKHGRFVEGVKRVLRSGVLPVIPLLEAVYLVVLHIFFILGLFLFKGHLLKNFLLALYLYFVFVPGPVGSARFRIVAFYIPLYFCIYTIIYFF